MSFDAAIDLHERVPPHNYEAEQALLAAVMADNRVYERVVEAVRPEHFADPVHGRIFAACGKMIERNAQANPVTLARQFDGDEVLREVGGAAYLAQLANSVVTLRGAADYAKLIADLWRRREIIARCHAAIDAAYAADPDMSAVRIQERHEAGLFAISAGDCGSGGFRDFSVYSAQAVDQFQHAYKHRGQVTGIPTGLRDLDRMLCGLQRSDLVILAGRPSMGKTSMATTMAVGAARAGRKVGFFSLEMPGSQLAARIVAAHAGVDGDKARRGDLTQVEFERLVRAEHECRDLGFYIDQSSALTVPAMRARARRLARQRGLDLIVVDYIGLAQSTDRKQTMTHQIQEITTGLKALAKDLNVPVVALSQLSRAVEQREDKRPQLSDLRDSGSIEQDADVVLFVYREQYYLERSEPCRRTDEAEAKFNDRIANWEANLQRVANTADVIVAKQRRGPVGDVKLHFNPGLTQFGNLDGGPDHG